MVWLGDDVVRWWCGQVMVWAGDGWIWSELFCRGHGQPDEAEWWVQNIEMNRMSLSANPMCRWLPLDRKKGQGSGNMWTLKRAEKVLNLNHFSWFYSSQEESKGLRHLTFSELVHQQNGLSLSHFTSWSHAQSSWPSSCPVWSSSRLRRRKATWMSGSPQSCSRLAAVTECHQLREHHSHTLPTS